MSAWASDPWCSAGKTPAFNFEWQPKDQEEPSFGSVVIKDTSGNTIQVLDDIDNYRGDAESLYANTDFNNDGCPDLVVTSFVGASGNETLTAFLYDRKTQRFAYSEALSNIGGLQLDPRNKNCVTASGKGGADTVYSERHCWSKGKLVLKSESKSVALYDDNGQLKCYQHVDTEYRGGKKRTRTSCTSEF